MNHKINDDERMNDWIHKKGINFRWFGPSADNLSFQFPFLYSYFTSKLIHAWIELAKKREILLR